MFVRLRQNELTRSRGGVRDASRGLYPVISKEAVLRNKERGPEHAWLTNSKLKHLLRLTCHMDIKMSLLVDCYLSRDARKPVFGVSDQV